MPKRLKPIPPTPLETSQALTGESYIPNTKSVQTDPNTQRGAQNSMRNTNWKDLSVGIEDMDKSILYYFDEVIKPYVIQNSKQIKVPLVYGNPERWKSVQADGFYRDQNGKAMAPLIIFRREGIEKNRALGSRLDGNQAHLYQAFEIKHDRHNAYDKFSVVTNRQPAKKYAMSVVPDYVTITYSCILFTEYVEQMNKIIEDISFASDSYWGDPKNFMFRSRIDTFNNATELVTDGERVVKTNFTITLNGYIIAEGVNEKLATQNIAYGPAQVIVGLEVTDLSINQTPSNRFNTTFIPGVGVGNGGSNNTITDMDLQYIVTNNTFTADLIQGNSAAVFNNHSIMQIPVGSTIPSPSYTNGGFTFFINGRFVPPVAIAAFYPSGANLILNVNVSALGFGLDATDEVLVIGKVI